jgi:hypothetical protein
MASQYRLLRIYRSVLSLRTECPRPLNDRDGQRLPRMILQNIQAAIVVLNVLVL